MPILPKFPIRAIGDDEFAVIDQVVMRCAYAVHNKFGRLFDERIYENDLAARLRAEGLDVHTQVPVTVTHGTFQKSYCVDLLVNHMPYELKVVTQLAAEHDAQALHYAMLLGVRLVKLINFGEKRVRGKLLFNAIRSDERYRTTLRNSGMRLVTTQCAQLVAYLKELLHDWGTHLSCHLNNEAVVEHFGGETHCLRREELRAENLVLGTHPVQFHADGYAFAIMSLTREQSAYQRHLETLLHHSKLKGIQWINLNHSRVEITTLELARE